MLLMMVTGYARGRGPPGHEFVTLEVTVENPVGPLGERGRPPMIELRDGRGRVHPIIPDPPGVQLLRPHGGRREAVIRGRSECHRASGDLRARH